MLVLTRKPGEQIVLGENIVLSIVQVQGNRVRLSIDAPEAVRILRGELSYRQDADTEVSAPGITA